MNAATQTDSIEPRALPKQFLLTRRDIDPPAAWNRREFAGRYLYTSPELPVTRVEAASPNAAVESRTLILGWFVYEGIAYPNGDSGCLRTDRSIEHVYRHLTGRFIILSARGEQFRCMSDPGGLLSVVYRLGESEIAATPRALELAGPIAAESRIREGFERRDGTMWYAYGTTPYADVKRLLPGTTLDMPSGKTTPIGQPAESTSSTQAVVDRLFHHTRDFVAALGRQGTLECHLTAGWDSRMVVAAAIQSPAVVDYVTYRTPGSNGSVDCQISRLIARNLSLNHQEIALLPSTAENVEIWNWRTAGCIEDSVMHLAPTIAATHSGRYVLCGVAGEVGRGFYWRASDIGRYGLRAADLLARLGFRNNGTTMELSERWLEPLKGAPTTAILDQAYIDLRLGGWGGPSVYGHPVGTPTLTPFNNATVFSLMKALPPRYRLSGQFARDFVSLGSPALARLPINRAHGLQRIRLMKKEIAGLLPANTKRALRALMAR